MRHAGMGSAPDTRGGMFSGFVANDRHRSGAYSKAGGHQKWIVKGLWDEREARRYPVRIILKEERP